MCQEAACCCHLCLPLAAVSRQLKEGCDGPHTEGWLLLLPLLQWLLCWLLLCCCCCHCAECGLFTQKRLMPCSWLAQNMEAFQFQGTAVKTQQQTHK